MSPIPYQHLKWSQVKRSKKPELLAMAQCLGADWNEEMTIHQLKYVLGKYIMERHCVLNIPLPDNFWGWMSVLNPNTIQDENEAIQEFFPNSPLAQTLRNKDSNLSSTRLELPPCTTGDTTTVTSSTNFAATGEELLAMNEGDLDISSKKGGAAEQRGDTPVISIMEESNATKSSIMAETTTPGSLDSNSEKSFYSGSANKKDMEKIDLLIENQNQLIKVYQLMMEGVKKREK